MKITEIISEGRATSEIHALAIPAAESGPLPDTISLTDLKNTDPYMQYRMGLAIAAARARDQNLIPEFSETTAWGENVVVTAYTPEDEETLQLALKLMPGKNAQCQISSKKSTEDPSVYKQSPIQNRGGIQKLK